MFLWMFEELAYSGFRQTDITRISGLPFPGARDRRRATAPRRSFGGHEQEWRTMPFAGPLRVVGYLLGARAPLLDLLKDKASSTGNRTT